MYVGGGEFSYKWFLWICSQLHPGKTAINISRRRIWPGESELDFLWTQQGPSEVQRMTRLMEAY